MLVLLGSVALAGTLHTGIPVRGVDGLGPPSFGTSLTGWTAPVPDGVVRVFVGQSEQDASAWVERIVKLERRPPKPFPDYGDEAWGDGNSLLIVREGNLGLAVRINAGAMRWVENLQAAIVDDPTNGWPAPPMLLHEGEYYSVQSPAALHVAFVGGELVPDRGLFFTAPPSKVVAWDPMGRAVVAWFDQEGRPTDPPPDEPEQP